MIRNFFITALRTLRRNKLFALINVLGLSIGISAALIIYLMVQYDFSFEQFRPDRDRTYRVVTSMSFGGRNLTRLFITTGWSLGTQRAEEETGPGGALLMIDTQFTGLPEPEFGPNMKT